MQAPAFPKVESLLPPMTSEVRALRGLGVIVAGSALLALSAQIRIPMWPVPVTAQTLALFVIAGVLGGRRASGVVAAYVLEGSLGLPVFAGATGGASHLLGPTGGYLAGFFLAALVAGRLMELDDHGSLVRTLFVLVLGNSMIYAIGALWLARYVGGHSAIVTGVLPFLAGDAVKIFVAALILTRSRVPRRSEAV